MEWRWLSYIMIKLHKVYFIFFFDHATIILLPMYKLFQLYLLGYHIQPLFFLITVKKKYDFIFHILFFFMFCFFECYLNFLGYFWFWHIIHHLNFKCWLNLIKNFNFVMFFWYFTCLLWNRFFCLFFFYHNHKLSFYS